MGFLRRAPLTDEERAAMLKASFDEIHAEAQRRRYEPAPPTEIESLLSWILFGVAFIAGILMAR